MKFALHFPFALSLSKGISSQMGFDASTSSAQAELSPNGFFLAFS
jgi:hypothetical protein